MKKKSRRASQVIDFEEARNKRKTRREAEAQKKNNRLKRFNKEKPEKSKREVIRTNRRRYVFAATLLLIFLVAGFSMFNIVSLKMQEAEALELKKKLLDEKKQLQSELAIVHSPDYVEQQARAQLKMIKPGETLYIFPQDDAAETEDDDKETE